MSESLIIIIHLKSRVHQNSYILLAVVAGCLFIKLMRYPSQISGYVVLKD